MRTGGEGPRVPLRQNVPKDTDDKQKTEAPEEVEQQHGTITGRDVTEVKEKAPKEGEEVAAKSSLSKISERIQSIKEESGHDSIKTMSDAERRSLKEKLSNIKNDLKSILQSSEFSIAKRLSATVKFIAVKFFESSIDSQIAKAEAKEDKATWKAIQGEIKDAKARDLESDKKNREELSKAKEELNAHKKAINFAEGTARIEVKELLKDGVNPEQVQSYLKEVVEDKGLAPGQRFAKIDILVIELAKIKDKKVDSKTNETLSNLIMDCAKADKEVWKAFASEIKDELSNVFERNKTDEEVLSKIKNLIKEVNNATEYNFHKYDPSSESAKVLGSVVNDCYDAMELIKNKEPLPQTATVQPEKAAHRPLQRLNVKQAQADSKQKSELLLSLVDLQVKLEELSVPSPNMGRSDRKTELTDTRDALQKNLNETKNLAGPDRRAVGQLINAYDRAIEGVNVEIKQATAGRVRAEFKTTEETFNTNLLQLVQVLEKIVEREGGNADPSIKEMINVHSLLQEKSELLINRHLNEDPPDIAGFIDDPEFYAYSELVNHIVAKNEDYQSIIKDYLEKNKDFREEIGQFYKRESDIATFVGGLIINPVQRIPRHVMLLRETIKHTPENTAEYQRLTNSAEFIDRRGLEINENKRDVEIRATLKKKGPDFINLANLLDIVGTNNTLVLDKEGKFKLESKSKASADDRIKAARMILDQMAFLYANRKNPGAQDVMKKFPNVNIPNVVNTFLANNNDIMHRVIMGISPDVEKFLGQLPPVVR